MNDKEILDKISQYKFYHIIPLTETISTPGNPVFVPAQKLFMRTLEKTDVKAKRVLDIGCRDGLFSFKAESMGAQEIIGIDNDLSVPATEFLMPFFQSKVKMQQLNLYDLTPEHFGVFDVVLFPGVLYHLRYPFWGLKVIRDIMKPGGELLIETAIWQGDAKNAFLFCPINSDSPYEPSSCTFFNEKGLIDTLKTLGFQTKSVSYVPTGNKLRQLRKGLIKSVKTCLSFGNRPPIREVCRAVFHCTYQGVNPESRYHQYWEGMHDIHSTIGG
jgi:SAM-dependent methyltransferase